MLHKLQFHSEISVCVCFLACIRASYGFFPHWHHNNSMNSKLVKLTDSVHTVLQAPGGQFERYIVTCVQMLFPTEKMFVHKMCLCVKLLCTFTCFFILYLFNSHCWITILVWISPFANGRAIDSCFLTQMLCMQLCMLFLLSHSHDSKQQRFLLSLPLIHLVFSIVCSHSSPIMVSSEAMPQRVHVYVYQLSLAGCHRQFPVTKFYKWLVRGFFPEVTGSYNNQQTDT